MSELERVSMELVGGDVVPVPTLPDGFTTSEVANADRLVALAGDHIRYVHAWGSWLVWDGTRWKHDTKNALVTEQAKTVGRQMAAMFSQVPPDNRKAFIRALTAAESANGIASMVTLARGVPGIIVEHGALDADPWILNLENGTLDLRSGDLRPHNPDDLITKVSPVRFDPAATCPTWEAALARWFPEPELRDYAQRLVGYTVVGDVGAEILVMPYGDGANGKTKFVEAIADVCGPDYSTIAEKSLLVMRRGDEHPTGLAQLFGVRFAHTGELEHSARLNEASVKNLTGGDTISARRMREDLWTFTPTHTLWAHTNHLPTITGQDEGIWRRIRVLPFTVTIPADERDQDLGAKLRSERSGILRWILEGVARWQIDGLTEPAEAKQATASYRHDMDTFGRFLDATGVTFDRRLWIPTADLRDLWTVWAEENGEPKWSAKAHADRLRAGGAEQSKRTRQRGWKGIGLPAQLDITQPTDSGDSL